jgi:hypothetical protein
MIKLMMAVRMNKPEAGFVKMRQTAFNKASREWKRDNQYSFWNYSDDKRKGRKTPLDKP